MTVDYRRIGARAREHVRHLAVDIGPRGSATEGERRGSSGILLWFSPVAALVVAAVNLPI